MNNAKSDLLQVIPEPVAPDGTHLEPEERPARRLILEAAPIGLTNGQSLGGSVPASMSLESTVGEMATQLRHACRSCAHWNHPAWVKLKRSCEKSTLPENRRFVEKTRRLLLMYVDDALAEDENYAELEEMLEGEFGLCTAMTEIFSKVEGKPEPAITHALAGCPDEVVGGENLALLYKPTNNRAELREGEASFDKLMSMALGRSK